MVHRCISLSFIVACSAAAGVATQPDRGESCPASGCDVDSIVVDESSLLARHRSVVKLQNKVAMEQPMRGNGPRQHGQQHQDGPRPSDEQSQEGSLYRDQQVGKGKGKGKADVKSSDQEAHGSRTGDHIEQYSERNEEQHRGKDYDTQHYHSAERSGERQEARSYDHANYDKQDEYMYDQHDVRSDEKSRAEEKKDTMKDNGSNAFGRDLPQDVSVAPIVDSGSAADNSVPATSDAAAQAPESTEGLATPSPTDASADGSPTIEEVAQAAPVEGATPASTPATVLVDRDGAHASAADVAAATQPIVETAPSQDVKVTNAAPEENSTSAVASNTTNVSQTEAADVTSEVSSTAAPPQTESAEVTTEVSSTAAPAQTESAEVTTEVSSTAAPQQTEPAEVHTEASSTESPQETESAEVKMEVSSTVAPQQIEPAEVKTEESSTASPSQSEPALVANVTSASMQNATDAQNSTDPQTAGSSEVESVAASAGSAVNATAAGSVDKTTSAESTEMTSAAAENASSTGSADDTTSAESVDTTTSTGSADNTTSPASAENITTPTEVVKTSTLASVENATLTGSAETGTSAGPAAITTLEGSVETTTSSPTADVAPAVQPERSDREPIAKQSRVDASEDNSTANELVMEEAAMDELEKELAAAAELAMKDLATASSWIGAAPEKNSTQAAAAAAGAGGDEAIDALAVELGVSDAAPSNDNRTK